MRNDVCTLIIRVGSGSQINETSKEIFCEKSSCSRSEFYQAYGVGLQPKLNIDIDPEDYESMSIVSGGKMITPQRLTFNGATYNILRTYQKDESTLSLTVG